MMTLALSLAGCGTPGAPQPPSLGIPVPVSDLRALRQGERVLLSWTPPQETTDRQRIRHPGPVLICRTIADTVPSPSSPDVEQMQRCDTVIATIASAPPPPFRSSRTQLRQKTTTPLQPQTYSDVLPQTLTQQHADGIAVYVIEAQNPEGKSAGLSNPAWVPLAPTWPAPSNVIARITAAGVEISWTGVADVQATTAALAFRYVVYRQQVAPSAKPAPPIEVASVPVGRETRYSILDRTIEWDSTYGYAVGTITDATPSGTPIDLQGERTPPVEVVARDVFPPAPPSGVEAVFSDVGNQRFIDLTWSPNTEADLAGYDIYRRETGTQPVRINRDLVKAPAFRDTDVLPGHQYFYSVSAVDLRRNESARSPETSETVPAQP
jgi:hypothetical protein